MNYARKKQVKRVRVSSKNENSAVQISPSTAARTSQCSALKPIKREQEKQEGPEEKMRNCEGKNEEETRARTWSALRRVFLPFRPSCTFRHQTPKSFQLN